MMVISWTVNDENGWRIAEAAFAQGVEFIEFTVEDGSHEALRYAVKGVDGLLWVQDMADLLGVQLTCEIAA